MLCLNGNDVTCWSALPEEIEQLRTQRKHKNLPGVVIPQEIRFTENIEE
ncbi:MAG: glycerol-3-phosphate dehydrogenase, partial [Clostridia bacterium]|nr:glycerol-3-phosphate dehydrogenase [Clostridia bacterium]